MRHWSPRGLAAAWALSAVGAAVAGCDSREPQQAEPADPQVVAAADSSGRQVYRPEVDEGLGVALVVLLDNSGSMDDEAPGDDRPKYLVARAALERMLDATDSAIARRPDFPVKVGILVFSESVRTVLPIQPYDRDSVRAALERVPPPKGGTAIGRGLAAARRELYRSGVFRKNVIVLTDGENTSGPKPAQVAREIHERSEGGIGMYFVAFDVDAEHFDFTGDVKGAVVAAADAKALGGALDQLYQGKVLAEALDAGEGHLLPQAPVSGASDTAARRP